VANDVSKIVVRGVYKGGLKAKFGKWVSSFVAFYSYVARNPNKAYFWEVFGYDVSYWCDIGGVFIEVFNRVKGGEGVSADCVFSRQ